ncbi:MAG TPA: hypothetical protein VFJ16_11585 [Longimicrobium sp.]|nr:hypothetical protein [Longimicrobium sp.]
MTVLAICGALASSAAAAQTARGGDAAASEPSTAAPSATAIAERRRASGVDGRNQVTVEAGVLSGGVSYARRMGESPWSVGAGVWGAWEPPGTFEGNVFEPVGLQVFTRYRPTEWFHTDVGLTAASYHWTDDCPACTGTLAGVRAAALVGHRMVFAGPEVTAGWASDDQNGSRFGVLFGAQLRVVIGWGN